jgi:hypothetical protein
LCAVSLELYDLYTIDRFLLAVVEVFHNLPITNKCSLYAGKIRIIIAAASA